MQNKVFENQKNAFFEANFFDLANKSTILGNTPNHSNIARGILNKTLSTTAASLSIAGTLAIFAAFWMWPDLRTNSRRMIVFISVGDFLVAVANIVGLWGIYPGHGIGCQIQAAVGVLAIIPSFFWTVYLSLYFYLIICRRISLEWEKRVLRLFHVTAWGIPLTIAVMSFALRGVGYAANVCSSGWCWISHDQAWWKMVLWMCVTGKAWEIIAYITISIFYVLVKTHIRKQVSAGFLPGSPFITMRSVEVAKRADHKLILIPVVFILVHIWGTIRFFRFLACLPDCQSTGPSHALPVLVILQGIGDNSQGFANFLLFCLFSKKIRERFQQLCAHRQRILFISAEEDPLLRSTNSYGSVEFK